MIRNYPEEIGPCFFNPYHDPKTGRFTSKSGAGGGGGKGRGKKRRGSAIGRRARRNFRSPAVRGAIGGAVGGTLVAGPVGTVLGAGFGAVSGAVGSRALKGAQRGVGKASRAFAKRASAQRTKRAQISAINKRGAQQIKQIRARRKRGTITRKQAQRLEQDIAFKMAKAYDRL